MSEQSAFFDLLGRARTGSQLSADDVNKIQHFPVNQRTREEEDIYREEPTQPLTPHRFMLTYGTGRTGRIPKYQFMKEGLESLGYAEIPGSAFEVGKGCSGEIKLGYLIEDAEKRIPLEARHLCAVKVVPISSRHVNQIATELKVLRGCVHENIVDYMGHYVVNAGVEYPSINIVMEYANAGDLEKEVYRHDGHRMRESHARYYALQIIAGVEHLHSRGVVHNDLHIKNVILKYNPDLSKTCMICDFGNSSILSVTEKQVRRKSSSSQGSSQSGSHKTILVVDDPYWFRGDVHHINMIISFMLARDQTMANYDASYQLSSEGEILMDAGIVKMRNGEECRCEPDTIPQFLEQFKWFRGHASPSFPRQPTPMLPRRTIQRIGYLEPVEPEIQPVWGNIPHEVVAPHAAESKDTAKSKDKKNLRTRFMQTIGRINRRVSQQFQQCLPRPRRRQSSSSPPPEQLELETMTSTVVKSAAIPKPPTSAISREPVASTSTAAVVEEEHKRARHRSRGKQ